MLCKWTQKSPWRTTPIKQKEQNRAANADQEEQEFRKVPKAKINASSGKKNPLAITYDDNW